MRRAAALLALLAPLVACDAPDRTSGPFVATLAVSNAGAHLTGAEEVPARETPAQGQATFQLSADGQSMSYRLNVANIENVVASHIHIGPAGCACPVAVFLYGPVPAGGGGVQGRLATGTFTAASFVGPLAGMTMADLVAAMRAGNAYVNVHTNDGVAPTNTGPGDFPGGEIRGQVDHGDLM